MDMLLAGSWPTRSTVTLLVAVLVATVGACGSKPTLTYQASRVVAAHGTVQVAPFTYVPAERGEVNPGQAQVQGAPRKGEQFDPDVDVFITDATTAYLEASGISVRESATQQLTGNIETFALDFGGKRHEVEAVVDIDFYLTEGADTVYQYTASSRKMYKWTIGSESYETMLGEVAQRCIQMFLVEAKAAEVFSGGESEVEPILLDVAP